MKIFGFDSNGNKVTKAANKAQSFEKWLRTRTIWQWALFFLAYCYFTYNSTPVSMFTIMQVIPFGIAAFVGVLWSVPGLVFGGIAFKTLGKWGRIWFGLLIVAFLFMLHSVSIPVISGTFLQWFIPGAIALFMTVGSQLAKLTRASSGVVSVSDPDIDSPENTPLENVG